MFHQPFPCLHTLLHQSFLIFLQVGGDFLITILQILLVQKPLRWAKGISDGLGGSVVDSIDYAVLVQIVFHLPVLAFDSELPMGLRNRCPREGKTPGIRQHSPQLHLIVAIFCPMRFVNQYHHIIPLVRDAPQLVEFLYGGDIHSGRLAFNNGLQVSHIHHLACIGENTIEESIAHLVFQVFAIYYQIHRRVV